MIAMINNGQFSAVAGADACDGGNETSALYLSGGWPSTPLRPFDKLRASKLRACFDFAQHKCAQAPPPLYAQFIIVGGVACNGGVGFITSPKGINVYSKTPPLYLATPEAPL